MPETGSSSAEGALHTISKSSFSSTSIFSFKKGFCFLFIAVASVKERHKAWFGLSGNSLNLGFKSRNCIPSIRPGLTHLSELLFTHYEQDGLAL